jgi:tryptophanyl-tRNA synthetase
MRYGDLKKNVSEMVTASLEPIQAKYNELMADRSAIREILSKGAARVRPIAEETIDLVRQRTGLYRG